VNRNELLDYWEEYGTATEKFAAKEIRELQIRNRALSQAAKTKNGILTFEGVPEVEHLDNGIFMQLEICSIFAQSVRICSVNSNAHHPSLESLVGRRLRVTVELIK
jgi:hypothetical protein